jgi:hypothetical protein
MRHAPNDREPCRKDCCYPLRSAKNARSSKHRPVGNLAGNFRPRSGNTLNALGNLAALGSSPGHQFFLISQIIITI